MDRKLQYELAKLAGVESESNNYYSARAERDYYAPLPKDNDGWINGDVLLRNVASTREAEKRVKHKA